MKNRSNLIRRRQLLKGGAAVGGILGVSGLMPRVSAAAEQEPRFLLVIGANGGASIIDSFLAIRHSESNNAETINAFPDEEVIGFDDSPFRAVDLTRSATGALPIPFESKQSEFVKKHKNDMLVATLEGTSVNHSIGQRRSITGNEAWKGRTLQECVALEYGEQIPIPNINMTSDGFAARGSDHTLPGYCSPELITQATTWSLGLDGSKGLVGVPPQNLLDEARRLRDEQIEPSSPFLQAFAQAEPLRLWAEQRVASRTELESRGLLEKLCLLAESDEYPLAEYNVNPSSDAAIVREAFPSLDTDPFEAQAALAYLLFKNRVCVSASIWPTARLLVDVEQQRLVNLAQGFDTSHGSHRDSQAFMWGRILNVIDRLIGLLSATPFGDSGSSLWDRTLIYVATDFGRTKHRVDGRLDFGSSHDLNNGVLMVSPMLRGNRVLGSVDPDTGLTSGFDLTTGEPDVGRKTSEAELFSGILDVMRVDTSGSGLPAVTAFRG